MTDKTKRRIKEFQAAIPYAREKIGTTAILLVIAMVIATVSTYAWVMLSRAPEVQSIQTTLSSNGSLEIGLAGRDGSEPEEFDVDESVKFNTDVMETNRLWGNIINLADDRYGFSELVLRPAQLNPSNISRNPLKGVTYGSDGRVLTLSTDFIYSSFDGNQFIYSKDKGVRAISSFKEEVTDATEQARKSLERIVDSKQSAVNTYYIQNIPGKMAALSDMISTYAQEKVNGTDYKPDNATVPLYFSKAHLQSAKGLYDVLYNAMELQKEAYIALANYQLFTQYGESYQKITSFDQFYANPAQYNVDTPNGKSREGIVCLQGLTTFVNDYKNLVNDREHFRKYIEDEWAEKKYSFNTGGDSGYAISNMISRLIDYGNMYIIYNNTKYRVTELQSLGTGLLNLNGNTYPCYIVNGIMKRFEQSAIQESYRLPKNASNGKTSIKIAMKVKKIITINFSVNGESYTEAAGDSYFNANFVASTELDTQDKTYVAEDTYGMAVDFWVRCNAERTYLTLAGAIAEGENGEILRYDGINRVWGSTGNANLTTNNTTQGGGSCYIYYADNPDDMKSSLLLLRSIKVAFVQTGSGTVFATAVMDTSNYWAQNGRITVPLVVEDTAANGVEYTYLDETNAEVRSRAITELLIDEAKDITAIVYLDGTTLENKHVLAVNDIEGQLNIQFGSSEELRTVGDNDLIVEERYVTAHATKTNMNYDTATYDSDLTTTVIADVVGVDPVSMEGFFVRAVNATQGERESKMTFTKQADGTWSSNYKFDSPGSYYLRYLRVNGVDYALPDPVQVLVEGFKIADVTWQENDPKEYSVFSVDSSYRETVGVKFETSDVRKMPKKVYAAFERAEDGVDVFTELIYQNQKNVWSGTVNFGASGRYTLKYLVQDGKYVDLATANNGQNDFTKKLTLTLGLTVAIYSDSTSGTEQFDSTKPAGTYYKNVKVRVFDNSGTMLTPPQYDENGALIEIEGVYLPEDAKTLLRYSPLTADTDLTWDNEDYFNGMLGCYTGTLQITKAGRYVFRYMQLGDNVITKATESPIFAIIPPEPPTYLPRVTSDHANKVQFAPLTNDAYIGPIGFQYAESAGKMAIVKNSITGKTYQCEESNGKGQQGTIYQDPDDSTKYYISLPTYTLDVDDDGKPMPGATYTQEGVWTLEAIVLWDCYDSASNSVSEENPLYFASALPAELPEGITPALVRTDLSAHQTEVSCSINVVMLPGNTQFGDSAAPFMKLNHFSDTGAYLTLKDNAGRTIPKEKISSDGGITLGLSYNSDNTKDGSYGYVTTGLDQTFEATFNFNSANNRWEASKGKEDFVMRYVGPYKVTAFTVNLKGGKKLSYTPGSEAADAVGVPAAYTVYSKGPDAQSGIKVDINNSGDTFSGSFLQSYTPDTQAKVSLVYTDEDGKEQEENHVVFDLTAEITYTYQKNTKPAGFTWASSAYESIKLTMSKNATSGKYTSPATPLLPGQYTQKITVNGNEFTKNLKTLKVTATKPTVKVSGVSPSGVFKTNRSTSGNGVKYLDNADLIDVQNFMTDYTARLYISATGYSAVEGTQGVQYSLPSLSMTLSGLDMSNINSASFTVANKANTDYNQTYSFNSNNQTVTNQIGGVKTEKEKIKDGGWLGSDVYLSYDVKFEAGALDPIKQITITGNDRNDYTVDLSNPVTITENNEAPPSISFAAVVGHTVPGATSSTDGNAFKYTLPVTIGVVTGTDYKDTSGEEIDWSKITPVDNVTANKCYIKLGEEKTKDVRDGCETITYHYYTYTLYKYARHQYVYTTTTELIEYETTEDVVKWVVGGVEYSPGEEIEVKGAVTAVAVVGVIGRKELNKDVNTVKRITYKDVSLGEETITQEAQKYKTTSEAFGAINPPSGYSWFDSQDKEKTGDLNTNEHE